MNKKLASFFVIFVQLIEIKLYGETLLVCGSDVLVPHQKASPINFGIASYNNSLRENADAWRLVNQRKELFSAYVGSMRNQPGYQDFIVELYNKIHSDYYFRKSLEYMPGFKGRTGFLDFIGDENKKIDEQRVEREKVCHFERAARERKEKQESEKKRQEELKKQQQEEAKRNEYKQYRLQAGQDELDCLVKKYQQKVNAYNYLGARELLCRYRKRVEVLREANIKVEQAHDYSSEIKYYQPFNDHYGEVFNYRYGTSLDKQLHEELCQTRSRILELSAKSFDNFHVRITVPMMSYYTALAKVQKSPTVAFNLADFADELTRVIARGIVVAGNAIATAGSSVVQIAETIDKANAAIESGLVQAAKTTLNPEHWKDMLRGVMDFWVYVSHESLKEERREQAMWAAALTGNTKHWH